jgi:thioredoxin reductase (NADPH)
VSKEKINYDVIIIGGGAAGLSAALWSSELQLKTLLLESGAEFGGQLLRVYNPIKNHLGIETENGRELRDVFVRQIENFQFAARFDTEVKEIDTQNKLILTADNENFSAENLIVATGVRRRRLSVEGEEQFKDKGIIESGKRDSSLASGKNALVVGGGDAAFENALILSETAASVTLVHRQANFRARCEFVEQVKINPKINVLTETIVRKITGSERVESVELESLKSKEIFVRNIEAVLIRVGVEPNTNFLRGKLKLDKQGYIEINQNCQTSVEGIYAVGDAANPLSPTVSSAVGMGATAAKSITNFKLRMK